MSIKSRITAFVTSVCMVSGLAVSSCVENVSALNAEDKLNPMPFDISYKINNNLKSLNTLLYSSYNSQIPHYDFDFSDMPGLYEHYDTLEFDAIYEKAMALVEENADFSEISDAIDDMYGELIYTASMYGIANVLFYSDTSSSEYQQEMNYTYNLYNSIRISIYQFIRTLAASDTYYDIMVAELGQQTVDSYLSDEDISEDEKVYMEKINSLQSEYYSLVNSGASEEEFAELYLESVKLNNEYVGLYGYDNYLDYAYDGYIRNYTTNDAMMLCDTIAENITPVFCEMRDECISDENYFNHIAQKFTSDEILDIVDTYTMEMSTEINDAYKYMKKTNAYSIEYAENTSRLDGAFTIYLTGFDVPYIFSTLNGNVDDMSTIIHEFGHYNEFYQSGQGGDSIDISEISSQGLELLYLNYYSEIFGDEFENIAIKNQMTKMLWSLVSGSLISDLEIQVYENPDMSADELISLYDDIEKKYIGSNGNLEWYNVRHIFETPGYYISYAVSAAVAFELWNTSTYDYDKAVSDYIELTSTASQFDIEETLSKAGMDNIFESSAIKNIASAIDKNYLNSELSGNEYDINQDGEVTSEDAYLILLCVVGKTELTDEQKAIADTNGDSDITAYDALAVLRKV
ncbi:MAG: dockerin type I domain-containing protein, partial [Oscillospiraceae bacterium]